MYNGLLHAHSGLRWILLLLLVVTVFKSLMKWRSNATFTRGDRQLNLYTLVVTHIQFLLGLGLYLHSSKVQFTAAAMKIPLTRFFTAEHSVLMLLAIVLVTIGYGRAKRMPEDVDKFKSTFRFFTLALLLLLAGIPWPFRNLGAGWF